MTDYTGRYCIVRGDRSGVFAGTLKERDRTEVALTDVRRLWYWDGACSLSQLAQTGTVSPENCKFAMPVDEILILDAVEIDLCTPESIKSINGVWAWKK